MNFQTLQNLVSYWVDDPNQTYFTPTQVQLFLNNAQREINKKLIQLDDTWYKQCVQTQTVTNQECYQLPLDFMKINHMQIILGGTYPNEQKTTLTHSTQTESDVMNFTSGQPATFFLEKNCLVLRPVPDNVYTIRMWYSYRVSDLIYATDVPDVPQEYHEYLPVLAALDCFLKDQRQPDTLITKKNYYDELMASSATDRLIDKPREIVQTFDDGFGTLF